MTVNPFLCEKFQMINCSKVFPPKVVEDCSKLFEIGKEQYKEFAYTRFVTGSKDVVQTTLKKNNLSIMSKWQTSKAKPISKLKLSNAELTKLRPACEIRPEAARELFKQEFTNMPECFVDKDGDPFHGVKSEILKVIAPKENALEHGIFKEADGLIFDISVEIRSEAAALNTSDYTFTDFVVHLLRRLERNAMLLKQKD